MTFFLQHQSLFDAFLLGCGFAFSQYIALKAGVFSIATAGLASIGAYATAIMATRWGLGPYVTLPLAGILGCLVSLLLAVPLAKLRGVFQGLATLAFVQIVVALVFFFPGITGGALGLNNIPKQIGTIEIVVCTIAVFYCLSSIERTRLGRIFDALRHNETAAATLGISIAYYHSVAFGISGAIAGLYGGLYALTSFSITPDYFGFHFMITALSYVILGGRSTVYGPIVGVLVLMSLPEIFRPFAEQRMLVYGATLVFVITCLPQGIVDTLISFVRHRRSVTLSLSKQKAQRVPVA
jgi:branched-chain amino acid transport system permease protein